jgi:hypothetical protein
VEVGALLAHNQLVLAAALVVALGMILAQFLGVPEPLGKVLLAAAL